MTAKNKDLIKLTDVPALLIELVGVTRTRATMYNWARWGAKAYDGRTIKLRTERRINTLYTTREWVEEFLRRLGR